jgi:hypothetical protein
MPDAESSWPLTSRSPRLLRGALVALASLIVLIAVAATASNASPTSTAQIQLSPSAKLDVISACSSAQGLTSRDVRSPQLRSLELSLVVGIARETNIRTLEVASRTLTSPNSTKPISTREIQSFLTACSHLGYPFGMKSAGTCSTNNSRSESVTLACGTYAAVTFKHFSPWAEVLLGVREASDCIAMRHGPDIGKCVRGVGRVMGGDFRLTP